MIGQNTSRGWYMSLLALRCCRAMSISSKMSTMSPTRTPSPSSLVAVAQLGSTSDKATNLWNIAQCAGWARQRQGCMLFLPECFGFMGSSGAETLENCEPPLDQSTANDDILTQALEDSVERCRKGLQAKPLSTSFDKISLLAGLQTIARASGLWISAGGMHVGQAPPSVDDRPRVYNTHVILDDKGTVVASYHKVHLFDLDIPGKVTLKESNTTAPGTELVTCDSLIGKLGLTTCYDVRFSEQYTALLARGAQVLLVPSAFTVPTGQAHWHTLLKARAIETQCYVIAAAQFGRHNDKRESYGHSLVVDPWGTVLADAGGVDGFGTASTSDTPSIVVAEVDLDLVDSTRQRMPIQQHRADAQF